MTSTTQGTHETAGTAVALADLCKRLEGSPIMGSLAQLFGAMASGASCSEAASNAATAEKSAGEADNDDCDAATAEVANADAEAGSTDSADAAEEGETGEEDAAVSCSSSDGIFTDDEIASLLVGFVAGAAVVGGGCLMYKLLKD
ncbi:MAG: hypothetical protein PHT80_14235 [Lentisphaeria bacterium]|nr:hypothetical protein [Lentisphaeria bacterium]